jgi:hypothetical protein
MSDISTLVRDWIQLITLRSEYATRGGEPELERTLDAAALSLSERTRGVDAAIGRLRGALQLTATEELVAWCLVAQQLDAHCANAFEQLSSGPEVSFGALRAVVYGPAAARAIEELGSSGRLFRFALVERTDSAEREVAWTRRTVRATDRLLAIALGGEGPDDTIEGVTPLRAPSIETDQSLTSLLAGRISTRGILAVRGPRGGGRATIAASAIKARGHRTYCVSAAAFPADVPGCMQRARAIALECKLFESVPVVRDADALLQTAYGACLRELADLVDTAVVVTVGRGVAVDISGCDTQEHDCLLPCAAVRAQLWQLEVPHADKQVIDAVSKRFAVTPAVISKAAQSLTDSAAVSESDVQRAIGQYNQSQLRGLAERIDWKQTGADLVLPSDQLEQLSELVARVTRREVVLDDWGFADKMAKGFGVTALFSGPPGTGKTMVAALVAREVGVDLYRVDLSKVVSKYIGETEKQLAALFDAAEGGHVALLFDEADALFAKRTEVKSSNDRYANQEVNFLLQRIETFTGIAMLTTNHESAVDEAFRRRLSMHVRFPMPESDERTRLWRAMIPAKAAIADDVDFERLADEFVMTGGYIRNAVLRAAFLAADAGEGISMRTLWHAACGEYEAMGKIATMAAAA